MALTRIMSFVRKSPGERSVTVRFLARRGLSRVPFMPVRVRISMSPGETVYLWWSFLPADFWPERSFAEYWGEDVGELPFLWRFLRPGQTFLDVGAYHGIYAVLAGKKLQNRGRVMAFEPSPRERRRLSLHLKMNRLSSVSVEDCAVGPQNGRESLYVVMSDFTTMNSLRSPHLEGAVKAVPVETRRLDDYVREKNLDALDLLKIDAVGGELGILRGGEQALERFRPLVLCEVLDWVTSPWGYAAHEIVSHLAARGYDWFEFAPDGMLRVHSPKTAYPDVRNYLAVPREKRDAVREWVTP